MPLYFAYGPNMDAAEMVKRCPASRSIGQARLNRHRLVVTREGTLTVARDPRRAVHGLLWDVALSDISALDRSEGLGSLSSKAMQAVSTPDGIRRAIVYLARPGEGGAPKSGYLDAVIAAGRSLNLPAPYLAEIAALAQVGTGAPGRTALRTRSRP